MVLPDFTILWKGYIPVRELSYCACSNSWRDFRGFFEDLVSAKYLKYGPSKLVTGKSHSLRRSPYFFFVTVESPHFVFDFIFQNIFWSSLRKGRYLQWFGSFFGSSILNMNISIFEFNLIQAWTRKNWRK